ncbi:MAG: peptide ABC transporter substrate-binding protein [Firmicutes bacterium]|uniref:Oligopeptide transport system substrate-binding protein n=1 Tax=Melghirimyces thermohalophilus TaxID=1236220 RepID=A0A1G6L525_9BACL|nr:peptide ABC transporter substrate-binding protein [Melghirimyces thermohalophilus]MDA8353714.1 peptide ABC transporter substrate-binding protein [Bacillota bacterium]SDC38390.1 oligopeptide transport system substrate-binding protein [Melghirimyces thermohalophilus]
MARKRLVTLTALVTVVSLLMTACGGLTNPGGAAGGPTADEKQVLNMTFRAEPPTLDSADSTDVTSFNVLNNVMEGLYRLDQDNRPQPAIASSVDISEDKTTYTFHLRDAKWSDGKPVTAHDFEYAWKRALKPETKGEYAHILFPIKNAEAYNKGEASAEEVGVEAVDDKTLKVELNGPIPYFLSMTAFATYMPQRKDIVEKHGKQYASDPDKMVYNGPFNLEEWKHEQRLTLQKSDTYWDRNSVRLETVHLHIVKDNSTGVNLYNTEKVDVAELNSALAQAFRKVPEYLPVTGSAVQYIQFNTDSEFFSNENIRKAVSYAIDREPLIKALSNGSKAAYGLVPPTIMNSDNENFRKQVGDGHQYNPAEAKRLFKKGMKELGVSEPPSDLTLLSYEDHRKEAAVVIKEQLKTNLGLDIKIDPQPFEQKLDRESNGEFEMTFAGWMADYNDPMSYLDMFLSDNPFNRGDWSNKDYDELIEKAKKNSDYKKRAKQLVEAEKILHDEVPIAPLYYAGKVFLQKKYVKDLVRHPVGAEISLKWAYLDGKEDQ